MTNKTYRLDIPADLGKYKIGSVVCSREACNVKDENLTINIGPTRPIEYAVHRMVGHIVGFQILDKDGLKGQLVLLVKWATTVIGINDGIIEYIDPENVKVL